MWQSYRNIDDINNVICKLPRVICGEVVPAAFDEQKLTFKLGLQSFEGAHIRADIFTDGCVRASTGFYCKNSATG